MGCYGLYWAELGYIGLYWAVKVVQVIQVVQVVKVVRGVAMISLHDICIQKIYGFQGQIIETS